MHTTQSTSALDRRTFLAILSAAGTAALTAPALAKSTLFAPDPTLILEWQALKPGFHAVVDQNTGGNTLVFTTKDQALLIDTKFAHLAGALRADALAMATKDATLTLINTHHHGDHTGGNGMVVPFAADSYAHENAIDRIKSQLPRVKQGAKGGPARLKGTNAPDALLKLATQAAEESESWTEASVTPTHALKDKATLTLADTKIDLYHFDPAHTDNDLVVHFPDHNLIHTGDLVFNKLHPFFDPNGGGSALGWKNALKSILKLCDDNTTIIPGHGDIDTTKAVKAQLNYITKLIAHVQADIKAGVPKSETTQKTWDFMQGLGFEGIRERAIAFTYDELAG
jgi:cyclase